jgi:hypothetical protein
VITLFAWLYVSVGILMTFGENLHGREEIWAHKIRLRQPRFIKGTVISQESERSCISMLWVLILHFSMISIFDFGIGSTVIFLSVFVILLLHK